LRCACTACVQHHNKDDGSTLAAQHAIAKRAITMGTLLFLPRKANLILSNS